MEKLTYNQKIAIMRILLDIVLVDGRIDSRELEFYNRINNTLQLGDDARKDVELQNSLLALLQISELNDEQKQIFAEQMGQMIIVDKDINYKEVMLYNTICDFCKISDNFPFEEYDNL